METATRVREPAIQELEVSLRGDLLQEDDEEYDSARRVWNGMIDRKPAIIVQCAGVADVIAAVNYAREHEMLIAVRGGGHSVPGHSTCDGGLLIDLSRMKSVRVNPERRTAQVEAGALWGDVDHETQAFGLAVTGGQVSHTGVAGLTLGGGFGYLTRKYGYSVDNLLSVDIVTADGRFHHASATENPDLFWGVRGGGGNFGVVTSFEFQLHPVGPIVTGGMLLFPIEEARALLMFFREYMASAAEELTCQFALITAPPAPFVPEAYQGKKMAGILLCHCGSPEQAARDLEPLRAAGTPVVDLVGPMPYTALQRMIDELNAPGGPYYAKGHFLTEMSDDAIDAIVAHAPTAPSPLSAVLIVSLGGAASRVPEEATAMSKRDAKFSFDIISHGLGFDGMDENIQWTRDLWQTMKPFGSGFGYVNLDTDTTEEAVHRAYPPQTYDRLVALKNMYDPKNLFRLNQNIRPTV